MLQQSCWGRGPPLGPSTSGEQPGGGLLHACVFCWEALHPVAPTQHRAASHSSVRGLTSNRLHVHSPLASHPHGALPRRRHLDLCWQWRSEESDRAALDRRLGLEGLTSSAAFAGIESAGQRCTYLDMQL